MNREEYSAYKNLKDWKEASLKKHKIRFSTRSANKSWKWVRLERGRIIRMAPPMHSENEWDEKGTVPALTTPAYASDLATAG